MTKVQGGPHALASTLENINLCVAYKPAAKESVRAFFAQGGPTGAASTVVGK
jgi:hypothetical protein